jgi:hypothetical protein
MTIADRDHFQQKIANIRADCRYEFELPRAPDFILGSRSALAVGAAVGRAVSG